MAGPPETPERSRSSSIDTIRMTPGTSIAEGTPPSPATVTGPDLPDVSAHLSLDDHQPHTIVHGLTKSAPLAGNVYIIKSASSEKILSWIDWCNMVGTISAASTSILDQTPLHWKCVRHGGWFGLMNMKTGRFLGRDGNNYIICAQVKQLGWERFVVEPVRDGAFILRQEHEGSLYPIAVRHKDDGSKRMAKLMDVDASGYELEFYEVAK